MNFYTVCCNRERLKDGKWIRDIETEKLIVVAENDKEAIKSINDSLSNIKSDTIRHVVSGEIYRCNGLLLSRTFFGDGDTVIPV